MAGSDSTDTQQQQQQLAGLEGATPLEGDYLAEERTVSGGGQMMLGVMRLRVERVEVFFPPKLTRLKSQKLKE